VQLRDRVELAVRRWHAFELLHGGDPVVDYDCAPTTQDIDPYPDRFAALDELLEFRLQAEEGTALATSLEAHTAYLSALLGQQSSFQDYIMHTQGCGAIGWSSEYVEYRGWLARESLAGIGVEWNSYTRTRLRELEGEVPVGDVGAIIREYADKFEPSIRELTGAAAEFELNIENVETDAYWSYWLDGAGRNARLRINLANASFTTVEAYRFALHEVLGHALQYANLAHTAEKTAVDWPRLLAIHCPQQVLFEGLGQVLPLVASPDDELVRARTKLDHYLQLVRAEFHVMVNQGMSIIDCRDYAINRVPFWPPKSVASDLTDRSRNPQLRTYLWAYPAGIDWFVRLHETAGTLLAEVLRDAYQRPLSPGELQQRWPSGPTIGGDA